MRTDAIGPRTWLLVAVAGWALVAWLLAVAGMGGVIRPLPADPSLVQALPQLRPAAAERLGPLDQYTQMSARPPTFASASSNSATPRSVASTAFTAAGNDPVCPTMSGFA